MSSFIRTKEEMAKAITELQQAVQNFNYADENYIDIAVHQFNAAEAKICALVKDKKYKEAIKIEY